MYASLPNQLYALTHYAFSFFVLMLVFPRFLFPLRDIEDASERRVARYMRVILLYIVMGYAMILLNLFEVLAIVVLLLLIIYRDYLWRSAKASRMKLTTFVGLLFYEPLDVGFRLKRTWPAFRERFRERIRGKWLNPESRQLLLPRVLLLIVLAGAAYLRFYDALRMPAPSMSDGYVTLAWMKYLEVRWSSAGISLFHDGIYPQGFHFILAYLHKFAAIDELYVLKYTGPLNGVLITYGIYFAASRWTGNRFAGLAAAVIYGLGGELLHGQDWSRQSATNSQEFAMVFVFPTFYFLARYLQNGKREDMWTGAAGVMVTGLLHTLVFGYVGMGLGAMMAVGLLFSLRTFGKRVWRLTQIGILAVVVAVIPLGIGEFFGKGLNSSSADFLTSKAKYAPPDLTIWDKVGLVALGVFLLSVLFQRKPFREKVMDGGAVAILAATYVLYEYGAVVTQSQVLATRSGSLWAMAMPFAVGLGLHAIWLLFRRVPGWGVLQAVSCAAVLYLTVAPTHLAPIQPYKMEWESGVDQYLRISGLHRPKTYMIITDHTEGYDLVLNNGYHMYLRGQVEGAHDGLLDMYDPTLPAFTKKGNAQPDMNIPNDVYIYNEKTVFEVSKSNVIYEKLAPEYAKRRQDNADLAQWIAIYQQHHNDLQVFYEEANLRIYHVHKSETSSEKQQTLWGSKS